MLPFLRFLPFASLSVLSIGILQCYAIFVTFNFYIMYTSTFERMITHACYSIFYNPSRAVNNEIKYICITSRTALAEDSFDRIFNYHPYVIFLYHTVLKKISYG